MNLVLITKIILIILIVFDGLYVSPICVFIHLNVLSNDITASIKQPTLMAYST